jgi:hypothetical protein
MKAIIDIVLFFLIKHLSNVSSHTCYFMWGFDTSPFTSKGMYEDNYL